MTFTGAVLAGGASRRMGTDKALLEVDGIPMVMRVAQALVSAGAAEVITIGGSPRIGALGLAQFEDRYPGQGPLGAVITALSCASHEVVAVLATDLVQPDPAVIGAVVAALDHHDVALPVLGGQRHSHHAVWHRRCLPRLIEAFDGGERAIKRVLPALDTAFVTGLPARALDDADTPDELASVAATGAYPASRPGPDTIEDDERDRARDQR